MEEEQNKIPTTQVRLIITAAFLSPLLIFSLGKVFTTILVVLLLFLVTSNRPYWIYILTKTFKRDVRAITYMIKCAVILWKYDKFNLTVGKLFQELVEQHPYKIAFHTETGPWTYKKLSDYSNQAAYMFKDFGVKRGDPVGVVFGDSGGAYFPGMWLALSYLGAPAALLPPQLRSTALIHSIKAAKIKVLLYSYHLVDAIKEIQDDPYVKNVKLLQYNMETDTPLLEDSLCVTSKLKNMPTTTPIVDIGLGCYKDVFIYIYTSGTTGLPKAAVITHTRYLFASTGFNVVARLTGKDVIYTALPLHHSAGGMVGAGQALVHGVTVVIREKFSVSHFWEDCIKYKCTIAQYIGEICRFLLSAAEKSSKSDPAGPHRLRLLVGNGLRPSIWRKFKETFKIPEIYELYGATEGNTNMINITSTEGAVGFVPRFASSLSPLHLVKCDRATGEISRDENGFCIACKPNEPGLMIGKLNQNLRFYSYAGYVDKDSTSKKVVKDVFIPGDSYFNSGDILQMDDFGYFYFRDRIGDTFRWKGENVSTTEVESILTKIIGLAETNVYGVEIPNTEGRAGMAAIVDVEDKLDLENLVVSMKKALPAYAHPIFIRVMSNMPITATFKMIKKDLQADGFDVNKIKDEIYFLNAASNSYVPLTTMLYEDIMKGEIRI